MFCWIVLIVRSAIVNHNNIYRSTCVRTIETTTCTTAADATGDTGLSERTGHYICSSRTTPTARLRRPRKQSGRSLRRQTRSRSYGQRTLVHARSRLPVSGVTAPCKRVMWLHNVSLDRRYLGTTDWNIL